MLTNGPGEPGVWPSPFVSGRRPSWQSHDAVTTVYIGQDIVFATRHAKQRQAVETFHRILGARVIAPADRAVDIDTDQFGTFSGERPRTLTAQDAAAAKAELAISLTGLTAALASEGTYAVHPGLGLPCHEELLLFVDLEREVRVTERIVSLDVPGHGLRIPADGQVTLDPLRDQGWPDQAVIVRAENGPVIAKGLTQEAPLRSAVHTAITVSPTRTALVEPDLRAHHNPTRRQILTHLSQRMAQRLATPCPDCRAPGFGPIGDIPGLPCRSCGTPTLQTRSTILACAVCPMRRDIPATQPADPSHCPSCNP